MNMLMKPAALKQGDTIAIIAPSSGLAALVPHRLERAKEALEHLGFHVKLFPTTKLMIDGRAGTPAQRVEDVHNAFKDEHVHGIVCAIGGLSSNELLPLLDFDLISKHKKVFCGYSDITVLHYALQKKSGLITFYGPAALTQFGEYPQPLAFTSKHFMRAITDKHALGVIAPSEQWTDELLNWFTKEDLQRPRMLQENQGYLWHGRGKASGKLVGGCLYSLLQLKGTQYDLDYTDKIFFLEIPEGQDFTKGTPIEYAESQLMDLENAGVFRKIKGLIVGRPFKYSDEDRVKFHNAVLARTKHYSFPVVLDVDVGHTDPMLTLPLGVQVTLDADAKTLSLDEAAVE